MTYMSCQTTLLSTVAVAGGCRTHSSSTAAAMRTRPWASGRVRQRYVSFPAQQQLLRLVLSFPSSVYYGSRMAWLHAALLLIPPTCLQRRGRTTLAVRLGSRRPRASAGAAAAPPCASTVVPPGLRATCLFNSGIRSNAHMIGL